MIDYIFPHNPDDRILKKACEVMKGGELVIVPTDTNWVFIGDPFHKNTVEKLYRLKKEENSHHFSLFCSSISMASELANISDRAFRAFRNKIPGHYTFIFEARKKIVKALKASKSDHQIGIRFVPIHFLNLIIESYKGPLISTNIHSDLMGRDFVPHELYSYEIEEILGNQVQLIIDPGESTYVGPSTIYDLREDVFELIREGAGPHLF